jgi:predicted enzyme related to lactoylglutathione lyase
VKVRDRDKAEAEKLDGGIIMTKMGVKMVGTMATILDSEKNMIALLEPDPV